MLYAMKSNMGTLILQEIYSKPNSDVPQYLDVLFLTDNGIYEVGNGTFCKKAINETTGYTQEDFTKELKTKYGPLHINEMRVTYDSDTYFLIANTFLLVLGYELNTYASHSVQCFWLIEDIFGLNRAAYDEFMLLNELKFPTS